MAKRVFQVTDTFTGAKLATFWSYGAAVERSLNANQDAGAKVPRFVVDNALLIAGRVV